jgi:TolB protein
MTIQRLLLLTSILAAGCASPGEQQETNTTLAAVNRDSIPMEPCPIPGGLPANHLIRDGEVHFKNLWRLSDGGENAEAYWNPAGDQLVYQRRWDDVDCDRIFVTESNGELQRQVSDGRGACTCSYFLPDGKQVIYGSTGAAHETCPPKPDMSMGYTWAIYGEYDIYAQDLETGKTRTLVGGDGYDAEATVSPMGDRIVFTSTRSGDIELWTCDLNGQDLQQVTDEIGYDGGAFFSHSGEWLVFRTTMFNESDLQNEHEHYKELLARNLIRPHSMEIMVIRPDGSERTQVTDLGKANWAPYFFPNDERILFCTNHHSPDPTQLNFDLFAIDLDGTNLERITFEDSFDSFPMFSPDGRFLVFSSNRDGSKKGDTNLFIAEWQ